MPSCRIVIIGSGSGRWRLAGRTFFRFAEVTVRSLQESLWKALRCPENKSEIGQRHAQGRNVAVVSSEAVISVILEIKLILKGVKSSELDCTYSSDVFRRGEICSLTMKACH
jgi:hypothetical protein